ncbi:hypothetical protein [Microbacterium sp.]|uniref:hypothetical protein n=1 Tax=Microbacterium sp. TaxID=51671 RepID=UPI002D7850A5|nr:hypothetical protein [Microbacterium sp.]HET6303040.1 hypothetical protein [Microbacterium sp.]
MTRTWNDGPPTPVRDAEVCPVCASTDVRVVDQGWFVLELERGDEVRSDGAVEFSCRDCGAHWE